MKTTNRFFAAFLVMLLFISMNSFSQEDKGPKYFTVTTMHWNPDSDMSMDEWKAGEKEYMEKVTSKNEHVMGAWYYTHLLTPNSNEVLYVQSFSSWEAIDKATAKSAELEKAAWTDQAAREAFLKKMASAYADFHSDEIYATLPGGKEMAAAPSEDAILYVRINKRAYPKDAPKDELKGLATKMNKDVIGKNEFIQGYWPSQHFWGSDRRDFVQAFMLNSMGDLDKMFDKNTELMKAAFSEDESKAMGKYFESHGDYIYGVVKL